MSARYPTGGSRVIIDDVVRSSAHPNMLGAGTKKAFEVADSTKPKPVHKAKPRAQVVKETQQEKKDRKRKEKRRRVEGKEGKLKGNDDEEDDE